MMTLAAVALTCWLCSLLALPRRPLLHNDVQELVYARLLGRQQLLMLLALVATAIAFFVLIVGMAPHGDITDERSSAEQFCSDTPTNYPVCYTHLSTGLWVEEQLQTDGMWYIIGANAPPPELLEKRGTR